MTDIAVSDRASAAWRREGKITRLRLLKNFYDEETFKLLITEFYNEDPDISIAAIESSASIGNEFAIPHLFKIIETGTPNQQLASIATMAAIKAPSSVDQLFQYFSLLSGDEVKKEILVAINQIAPFSEKAQELNRAILLTPNQSLDLAGIAVEGLVEAGRLAEISNYLGQAHSTIQKRVLKKVLLSGGSASVSFIENLRGMYNQFSSDTAGAYLCAYELLVVASTKQSFVLNSLINAEPETITAFVETLGDVEGKLEHPRQLFRIILTIPYVNPRTEAMIGDFVKRVVNVVHARFPHLAGYLTLMATTHIDTLFGKIRKQFLSIKGMKARSSLMIVLLAKLIEKYASEELLRRIQEFFQASLLTSPDTLIRELADSLRNAPAEDSNRLKACASLFNLRDPKIRIAISTNLSYINLSRPNMIRRLNRLVRIAGNLAIKDTAKKILEILDFAREERIYFLEETCVVTLCQLYHRKTLEDIKNYLKDPGKNLYSLNGYARGARFLPPRVLFNVLVGLLGHPSIKGKTVDIIIESMESWDVSETKNLAPSLIPILKGSKLTASQKERLGQLVIDNPDDSLFQTLLDLCQYPEEQTQIVAIKSLRSLAKVNQNIRTDILTNRLYGIMDHQNPYVKNQALITLIDLGDDYAFRVLADQLSTSDADHTATLVRELIGQLSREILNQILGLLSSKSITIQNALRETLGKLTEGSFAEEIRSYLINSLKEQRRDRSHFEGQEGDAASPQITLVDHAKLEFKFKREHSQTLTVFFADIVSYTERTSGSDTTSTIQLIEAFEGMALPTLDKYKGNLVKKLGDGILAVFKHPLNAVIAALSFQSQIEEYNRFRVGKEKFSVRIGLNTGTVIKKDGDIYGDVVNVASRMETAAKPGEILLTRATYGEVKDHVTCTPLGSIQVKGKTKAIMAYSADRLHKKIDVPSGSAPDTSSATDKKIDLDDTIMTPDYSFPGTSPIGGNVSSILQGIFQDITKAVEEVAKDYHEENALKLYLQEKWHELVRSISSEPEP
jgi:class 3 adenylate cyclase